MKRWKVEGAFLSPKLIVLNSYRPNGVVTAVFSLSSSAIDLFHDYLEQEARKGNRAFFQAVWTVIAKPKLYNLVTKTWTEQGPQTLAPWILPHSYTQARKNTVWTCVSQKVPFTTLGHSQHLCHLQSIVDRPINTMLNPRKMRE
ncbi:hypothetical protein TNCV_2625311 [Trichonephila clavipes]|nr:hypothetical protein TNCV_2625311 [Trichonephila clavipes]